ncbi:MAG TPA: SRPBCC domain-containing protein [Devosiaceae bacterium]|jgi:uncharacterized protein YndB with AHSA1/START domain|nr:SRPBCC domain-containing protein [Devosiaceae bacterium]
MPSTHKAEVTLPSDTEILVIRNFDAPPALVYRAFIEPALVKRWMLGPPGWSMPVCEIDYRIGGKYHYRWRNEADGNEFGLTGVFEEIEPEKTLNSRERFEDTTLEDEAHIATSFRPNGAGTRVVYLITSESKEARDKALATGMTDGMELSFQLLDKVLAEMRVH